MAKERDGKLTTSENNLVKHKIPNEKSMNFTSMLFSLTISLQISYVNTEPKVSSKRVYLGVFPTSCFILVYGFSDNVL